MSVKPALGRRQVDQKFKVNLELHSEYKTRLDYKRKERKKRVMGLQGLMVQALNPSIPEDESGT